MNSVSIEVDILYILFLILTTTLQNMYGYIS